MDSVNKLSTTTIVLHWLVAIIMMSLLAVGVYMEEFEVFSLYPIHKSIGSLVIVLVLARILWRIKNGWPKNVAKYKPVEVALSKVVHWVVILSTLTMPISGLMMTIGSGRGLEIFGWEVVALNATVAEPTVRVVLNEWAMDIGALCIITMAMFLF